MKPAFYNVFSGLSALIMRRPKLTLRSGFERYLAEVSPGKKSPLQDQSLVRQWMQTDYKDWPLAKLTGMYIAAQRDIWLRTRQPATVVRRLAILSHLYTMATIEWGHEDLVNPVKLIRKPKVRNSRDRRIYADIRLRDQPSSELDWIIRASRSKVLKSAVVLAVETAMRRSEIAKLQARHVDLMKRTALLPDTKNGYSRVVPLSPAAIDILRETMPARRDGQALPGASTAITRSFSRALVGARQQYERVCAAHRTAPNPKYFRDLRFHDLRHEAISRMAPHFQMHELAKISGHRDSRMLLRYYHPDTSKLARRLARM